MAKDWSQNTGNWGVPSLHTQPYRPHSTGNRIGQGGNTVRIPLGNGTLAEGLVLRVTTPDFFERISRSRSGWAHPWAQIEKVLEAANHRMASELQYLVLEALEEGRVQSRRGVSTKRLETALADPRNVKVSGGRMAVGRVAFLNRSEAKYWRQIDSGTSVHVGRLQGRGYWIDGSGRATSNMGGHMKKGVMTAGPRNGKWISTPGGGKNARGRAIIGEDGGSLVRKMVIRRPIQPQEYFERAWKKFNARGQALDALRGAISQVLGIPMTGVRRSWNATVATMR